MPSRISATGCPPGRRSDRPASRTSPGLRIRRSDGMPRLVSARYACSLPVTARVDLAPVGREPVVRRAQAVRDRQGRDTHRRCACTRRASLAPAAGVPGASIQATTLAPDRSWPLRGAIASTVVVMLPVKNASTPALSSRNTVVQSRQPTGPYDGGTPALRRSGSRPRRRRTTRTADGRAGDTGSRGGRRRAVARAGRPRSPRCCPGSRPRC